MELVVLSGKGGTGKTTLALALWDMFENSNLVDCDVDAPNVGIVRSGNKIYDSDFYGTWKAVVETDKCTGCGMCTERCKFNAMKDGQVNLEKCEGCGVCKLVCPEKIIQLREHKNAVIEVQDKNKGNITIPTMEIGSDASGRLVTKLRKISHEYSEKKLTIIDGSPGIGCPVIASATGCNYSIVITEPTLSGLSDLKRVIEVLRGLQVKVFACINKFDINNEISKEIEGYLKQNKITILGRIPFDKTVMESVNDNKCITEYKNSRAYKAINEIFIKLVNQI